MKFNSQKPKPNKFRLQMRIMDITTLDIFSVTKSLNKNSVFQKDMLKFNQKLGD